MDSITVKEVEMMSKPVTVALSVFLLSVRTLSVAAETRPSVSDFLSQVQATYDKMQTYSSVGDITSNISMPGLGREELHYTFSIKLARPHLYRIEWEEHAPNMIMRGAAWSAGDGDFITMPGQASPAQPKDVSTALAMATGVSGGAASAIPAIFFGLSSDSLKPAKDATFRQDADIEGDPCYVITTKTGAFGVTMWISKKSKLLRQIRDDFNGPMKIPQMNDEDARKVLQSMGQMPTAAAIKRVKAQMASAQSMMSSRMTGFSIQVQGQIVVNATLRKADFTPRAVSESKWPVPTGMSGGR
ncbi:MAG: outer membrane lipoprotein carrier protein LolA [Candidatus Binatales bacterium]